MPARSAATAGSAARAPGACRAGASARPASPAPARCCPAGKHCEGGVCVDDVCVPNCGGRECGNDGCGGACGTCREDLACREGTCVCDPYSDAFTCRDRQCGTVRNNCGQDVNCGACSGGKACDNGACKCPAGKIECGGACKECCNDAHCGAGTCDANGDCRWDPVRAHRGPQRFNDDMWIDTEATLYTNGLLVVENESENREWCCAALRPRILVVVRDTRGRAIWVSETFAAATVCPTTDITCDHVVNPTFTQQFPAHPELGQVVGKYAAGLDIYHSDGPSPLTFADRWITNIKTATDIAKPIVELAALFL